MLKNKKIILGVSGSIAAYKAVYLLRLLKKAGAEVKVVTSPSTAQFVGELSFASLSGNPVFSGLWEEEWSQHVELGLWGDVMLVAPATANSLAKFANGLCDNSLTAVYLAAKCPVILAPAMDRDMYLHPATQKNLNTLREYGNTVLETGTGFLASGLEGQGRMLEPEEIMEALADFFTPKIFMGKKLLITAGPTQEAIDPVRYISNHSTGKMGVALAIEAQRMGAEVTLILGPSALKIPSHIKVKKVISANDMLQAAQSLADEQDIMIYAAAVADYTPKDYSEIKLKKKEDDFNVEMKKTPDVLGTIGKTKRENQVLVGFALETNNEIPHAQKKLTSKNLDFVVLNSLQDKGAGFAHDTNKITILDKNGNIVDFALKDKTEVAKDILEYVQLFL